MKELELYRKGIKTGFSLGKKLIKQTITWLRRHKWKVLLFLIGVTIYLGYTGVEQHLKAKYESYTWIDILYSVIQLFVLELGLLKPPFNLNLEIARWLAPVISAFLAANALTEIFKEQLQLFKIRFKTKHIIICGLGNKGLLIAQKFIEYGKKVVVIESDEGNENIKECRDGGAIVLIGNAAASFTLHRAGLRRAKYLFPVCGQDSINAEIAIQASRLLTGKTSKPLTCMIHITNPQLCRLIKEREFDPNKNNTFRLEFFNLFDQAARALTDRFPPFSVNEKKGAQPPTPHLLIVGAGGLGESLAVHTAKKWMDYPGRANKKIKISMVDRTARQKRDILHLRYPQMEKICKLIPLEMEIESQEFEGGQFLLDKKNQCCFTMIYICLDNDSFAMSTALTLHQRLRQHNIPTVFRLKSETGLANLLHGEAAGFESLHGFGLLDRVLNPELLLKGTHEILAQSIHGEYLRDQLSKGETPESNPSLVPWEEIPESLKESNRRQSDYLAVKLKKIGCYIIPMTDWNVKPINLSPEEIEIMAKMEHDHWVEERLKEGWKYTPIQKDIKKKKSPFLVPWDDLPEEEKEKDRNPVRKMPEFLAKAGFQIFRREKR